MWVGCAMQLGNEKGGASTDVQHEREDECKLKQIFVANKYAAPTVRLVSLINI